MFRTALASAAIAALMTAGAHAQTTPAPTEPATPPATMAPADGQAPLAPEAHTDGMSADALPEGYTATDLATVSTDRLIGTNVVNHAGETIASIDDVLINPQGTVDGIVVTFGGVLGFGGSKVVLQPTEVQVMEDANQALVVRTDLTPEAIEARPAYEG